MAQPLCTRLAAFQYLDGIFCPDALRQALSKGRPAIFNTDQGAQFTADAFTACLLTASIQVRMDGRALDNDFCEHLWRSLKYEKTCLDQYDTVTQLHTGLPAYFDFYNRGENASKSRLSHAGGRSLRALMAADRIRPDVPYSSRFVVWVSLTTGAGLLGADKCKPSSTLRDRKSDFPNRPRTRKTFYAILRASSRIKRSS